MAKPMHITPDTCRAETAAQGLNSIRALCGTKLKPGEGAKPNAPLCGRCYRKAGWSYDKRHW
ncbi:hypothetical protein GIY23_20660 [Allosaccharopolyspora coralli]|uniref:Uncharacterized protein n=1 Tax=Allosaccharopolyspora coralli TaxID=2665642 RepID=A0A5Q3QJH9_9PSEU|nr:hypothetical protein [Allosaccharopolyspora coralli]QGK71609.1 hypothetical protein GIY23_20660 [Allosaccharopolyspora coralli]